jgi:hypothetical protein
MGFPDTLNALVVARRIAARLEEDGIAYGIGGALALGAWGAPRSTKDVDITVCVTEAELPRCLDALERAGVMSIGSTPLVTSPGSGCSRAGPEQSWSTSS